MQQKSFKELDESETNPFLQSAASFFTWELFSPHHSLSPASLFGKIPLMFRSFCYGNSDRVNNQNDQSKWNY